MSCTNIDENQKDVVKNMNILDETFCEAYMCNCCSRQSCSCQRDCACSIAVCVVGFTCIQPNTTTNSVPNSALFAVFQHALKSYDASSNIWSHTVKNLMFLITLFSKIGLIIERFINLKVDQSENDPQDDLIVNLKTVFASLYLLTVVKGIVCIVIWITKCIGFCKKNCPTKSSSSESSKGCCDASDYSCDSCKSFKCTCSNWWSFLTASATFLGPAFDVIAFFSLITSTFELCALIYDRNTNGGLFNEQEYKFTIADFVLNVMSNLFNYVSYILAVALMFCDPNIIKKQDQPSNDEITCKNKHCALSVVFVYLFCTIFIEVLMLFTIAGLFYYYYSASRQLIPTTPKPKTFDRKVAILGGDVSVLVLIMIPIGGLIRVASYIVAYTTYYWWLSKESVLFYKQLIESLPKAEIDNILKEMKVNATSVTTSTDDEGKIEMEVDIEREQQKFNKVKDSLDYYINENDTNCCLKFIKPLFSPLNVILCIIYVAMVVAFTVCLVLTALDDINDPNKSWPLYIGAFGVVLLVLCNIYEFIVGIFGILVVIAVVIVVSFIIGFIGFILPFVCILLCFCFGSGNND